VFQANLLTEGSCKHETIMRSRWGLWRISSVGKAPAGGLLTTVPRSCFNHGQKFPQDCLGSTVFECLTKCGGIWYLNVLFFTVALLFPLCLPPHLKTRNLPERSLSRSSAGQKITW
jgi:hypothetical protein